MALRKTGRLLSKAEILGVGVFSPLSIHECIRVLALLRKRILGQYPVAPSSPGPFVLLLILGFPIIW